MIEDDNLTDAYRNGFVDGQSKAAMENETIIKSVRAKAFSDGYGAGYARALSDIEKE